MVRVFLAYIYAHFHASQVLPQPPENTAKYDQLDGLACWVVQLHVWNIWQQYLLLLYSDPSHLGGLLRLFESGDEASFWPFFAIREAVESVLAACI